MSFKPTFKNLVWTAAFNRKRQFIPQFRGRYPECTRGSNSFDVRWYG